MRLKVPDFMFAALIAATLVLLGFVAALRVSPPVPAPQHTEQTTGQEKANQGKQGWEWFTDFALRVVSDPVAFFTLWIALFTAVLAWSTIKLWKAGERQISIAKDSADAAKSSADTARDALVKLQRAQLFVQDFPWLWRPDLGRSGKYLYDIQPLIINTGNTATKNMMVEVEYLESDGPLPSGFDFPYVSPAHPSLVRPNGSVKGKHIYITDEELVEIQAGPTHFYIYGRITYNDVFDGTPVHTTRFCTEVGGVIGNPFDPRPTGQPGMSTQGSVEIGFRIHPEHNDSD